MATLARRWLGTLGILLATSACSKAVFTKGARERFGLSDKDLARVQFFTSEEILLQREVAEHAKGTADNELFVRDAVRIEQVVIPKRMPCVALRVEGDYILASFAPRSPDHALWFAVRRDDPIRTYQLVELENHANEAGPFEPHWAKGFLLTWAGEKYRVVHGRSAHLLYEMDESFAHEKVRREPPGWRLSDSPVTP